MYVDGSKAGQIHNTMKSPSWITRRSLVHRVEQALESQLRSTPGFSAAATAAASSRTARAAFQQQQKPSLTSHRTFTQRASPLRNNNSSSSHDHDHDHDRQRRQAADDPSFHSIVDNPPEIVRVGSRRGGLFGRGGRHGWGLLVLAVIPVTALALGTWQVQRLGWKTELVARFEDRLVREPLPLPPRVDPAAIHDFDYRRVVARGRFRHDREMLVGPRMHDGEQGYMVVTPLERDGGDGDGSGNGTTTVLVNRGWINKKMRDQRARAAQAPAQGGEEALPRGEVVVEGLLREPWKKNMFTPDNRPDIGEFYFPDVEQMAALTGSQAVWVEQTMGAFSFPSSLFHRLSLFFFFVHYAQSIEKELNAWGYVSRCTVFI
ncbi:surf-like protein [Diatrype stigma]|uniref:SURF1-like protein n=1 Tax=Diatrype stigma TaxID=117547 RepID=A0AAN9YWQ7_9PEZI